MGAPADTFYARPILNSPYEYPGRHWELDEGNRPTNLQGLLDLAGERPRRELRNAVSNAGGGRGRDLSYLEAEDDR